MDTAHRQDDKVCFLSQNLLSCMLLIFYHTVEHYWQTSLEINLARDEAVFGWQWRQLDHMQNNLHLITQFLQALCSS